MPITLGCPTCGKRFRARDESAGKRVKCPFCQAAVLVPSAEESQNASAPTDVVPIPPPAPPAPPPAAAAPPPPPTRPAPAVEKEPALFDVAKVPPRPAAPPTPVPAATPGDWGAEDVSKPIVLAEGPAPAPSSPVPAPKGPKPARAAAPAGKKDRASKPTKPEKSPQEMAAAAWRKTRGGLFWVQFGLFWLALIGFVPFGKLVYERTQGPLPDGPGWVRIDGYVNSDEADAIRISKREEIDLLAYGVPVLLGGLALVLGRVTAGAAPRNSGAKGLFAFSGLFTLIALTGLVTWVVCERFTFREVGGYARTATLVCGGVGEFWFLLALGAAGATLRRPKAVRAVGFFALVVGLAAVVVTAGWDAYLKYGHEIGRPRQPDADWLFYEEAAKMLGWLLVVGTYGRAVRAVRGAIRDFLASAEDGAADSH
ncbi:MAG: ssp5 [Gemmataceae bacterium]|nr:ssp5 [Gemmataceae bacterium]